MNKSITITDTFKKKVPDNKEFAPEPRGVAFNINPLTGPFIVGNVFRIINPALLPVVFNASTSGGDGKRLTHEGSYGLKSINRVNGYSILTATAFTCKFMAGKVPRQVAHLFRERFDDGPGNGVNPGNNHRQVLGHRANSLRVDSNPATSQSHSEHGHPKFSAFVSRLCVHLSFSLN